MATVQASSTTPAATKSFNDSDKKNESRSNVSYMVSVVILQTRTMI